MLAKDTDQLLDLWADLELQESTYRKDRQRIEFELQRRMEADGATAISHQTFDVKLVAPSPTYDQGKLRGLAELVPPEELAKGFTPAHWGEPVWVEDKWNMTKILPLRKYGTAVTEVIESAAIPGTPKLSIKRKVSIPTTKCRNASP